MGRWSLAVIAIAHLGGCTALFGLQPVGSSDRDNDGIEDGEDNCPEVFNPDQSDFDHNGMGDACDLCTNGGSDDVDNDGIPDGCDGCIGIGVDLDHDNIDDACDRCIETGIDSDQDGIDDGCDPCIGSTGHDADGDGIDDACDQCFDFGVDFDHDGIDDGCDPCVTTNLQDLDGDEILDACDPCVTTDHTDRDGDGLDDICDPCICTNTCPTSQGPSNHDEDGDETDDSCDNCKLVPNKNQIDSDGDGVGDKCDPSGKPNHHVLFDAFTTSLPSWYQLGSGWSLEPDRLMYYGGAGGASFKFEGPFSSKVSVASVLLVKANAMATTGDHVEIAITDSPSATPQNAVRCGYLVPGVGVPTFTYVATHNGVNDPRISGTMPLPVDAPFLLAITVGDADNVDCKIITAANTTETIGGTVVVSPSWYVGVSAGGTPGQPYEFSAIEAVTQP